MMLTIQQLRSLAFFIPNTRRIHCASSPLHRFWESNPKGRYFNEEEARARNYEEQRKQLFGLKDGFYDLRQEFLKWTDEWKEKVMDDSRCFILQGDRTLVWKFDNPTFLKHWMAVSDSDHNEGFSQCEISTSPTGWPKISSIKLYLREIAREPQKIGKGLFHGYISTRVPKDGRIKKAGYCAIRCHRITKSFRRDSHLDWQEYTHLVMRVRGDGRSYMINISTAAYFDLTWNDVYHYVLYTRGGPYWQYVKIPFSKFLFGSKGRVQDAQTRIPLDRIASLGLALGQVDGPFNLEIDWIGVECDRSNKEEFAYEMYKIPKHIANV